MDKYLQLFHRLFLKKESYTDRSIRSFVDKLYYKRKKFVNVESIIWKYSYPHIFEAHYCL